MKQPRSSFLLPFLLLPFCFGVTTIKPKAGYFLPHYFPPLEENGSGYYAFTLVYRYSYAVEKPNLSVDLTRYNNQWHAGATTVEVVNQTLPRASAGRNASWNCKIPYSMFRSGNDMNFLSISITNPGYRTESYQMLPMNYSTAYSIDITKENGYYQRPFTEGWQEDFDGVLCEKIRYEWTGFAGDFDDPDYGLLPLQWMQIRMRNKKKAYVNLPIKSATLTIWDNIDVFKFGKIVSYGILKSKRVVDLSWKYVLDNHFLYFQNKSATIYSPDYREIRDGARLTDYDHVSNSIFLPTVKNGEIRTTNFTLDIYGVGEYNKDTISYDFSVTQTHNYMGSYPTSEWYVQEL